jgi:hypothetical protein
MRLWKWAVGVLVLMVAFLVTSHSSQAQSNQVQSNQAPSNPIKATGKPLFKVAVPPRPKVTFPRHSAFHPQAPNIHTHPPKKNKSWWPFGHK